MNPMERGRASALPLVLAGAAVTLAGYTLWERLSWRPYMDAEPRVVVPRGELADFEKAGVAVFESVSPSVVHITSPEINVRTRWGDVWRLPAGTGTGFVWDEHGYIVTNYHVVERPWRTDRRVIVRFANQREYEALVVKVDPAQDIAVVKLVGRPARLHPIPAIGTSHDLRVGQVVFAIGNPFGYDQTLTHGIISALNRPIQARDGNVIHGCIQVDAAINPGNSGGPLLDSQGRLIGMNTAIFSPSGASAGIGFAIPVDSINRVVPTLIDPSGQMGVTLRTIPEEAMVMIDTVHQGSGAEAAGLRGLGVDGTWGDVIVSIDGKPVHDHHEVRAALANKKRGEKVHVVVLRGLPLREERLEFTVELR